MNKHVKIVGLLHLIMGAMGLVALGFIFILVVLGFSLAEFDGAEGHVLFGVLSTLLIVITMVSTVPDLIVGYGLIKRCSWARTATIILSVINLFAFPFGTALGVYGLWVMFQAGAVEQFRKSPSPHAAPRFTGENA